MPTKKLAACLSLLILATGCVHQSGKRYFPAGMLRPQPASDTARSQLYSSHLNDMGEQVLCAPSEEPALRFTWLRTFHHPIAVRVSYMAEPCRLVATELSGAGGYDPGSRYRQAERTLTKQECAALLERLNSPQLWQPPPHTLGLDGAEWIIESSVGGYRAVSTWSPESGPVRSLGLELIRLSG